MIQLGWRGAARHRPRRPTSASSAEIRSLEHASRRSTIARAPDNRDVADEREIVARSRMVAEQLRARGISDPRVLDAMARVPRHLFVRPRSTARSLRGSSDRDRLRPDDLPALHRRLHRSRRCGWSRTIASSRSGPDRDTRPRCSPRWWRRSYSLEIVEPLAARAAGSLDALDYRNVHVRVSDGTTGWPEHAPYDRIVGAAAPEADAARRWWRSSPTAGSSRCPIGVANQELRVCRRDGDRLATARERPRQVRADGEDEPQ